MRLRVVIFDDEPAIRQVLGALCADRGYEVYTFPDPGLCPLYAMPRCPCPPGTVCADLLLVDLLMPEVDGLDYVEGLRARGCPTPQIALMSGAWPPAARARALRLGCRIFGKPFALADLLAWFDTVEAQVAPTRALLEWRTQGGAERAISPKSLAVVGAPSPARRCGARGGRGGGPGGSIGASPFRRLDEVWRGRQLRGPTGSAGFLPAGDGWPHPRRPDAP